MYMVSLFNEQTKVIHCNPSIDDHQVQRKKREWFLIPTIAYKVYVPEVLERPFNLFEETILKILFASYKTPAYIAERLLLSVELVDYIINDLIQRGFLTPQFTVTEQGKNALQGVEEPEQFTVGYIFYNPLTNTFWDAFVKADNMRYVQASLRFIADQSRTIELGKPGDPNEQRAFQIPFTLEIMPPAPNQLDILRYLQNHKKRLRSERNDSTNNHFLEHDQLPAKLSSVKFLEESFPLYVTTFLYMPRNLSNEQYYKVCHPFGKKSSVLLQQAILSHAEKVPSLQRKIESFLNYFDASKVDLKRTKSDDMEEASSYFQRVFQTDINKISPQLYDLLLDYFQTYKRLQSRLMQQNKGAVSGQIQSELSQFTIQSTQLLESVLVWLYRKLEKSTPNFIKPESYLVDNPMKNAKTLRNFALQIGFVETRIDDDLFFEQFEKLSQKNQHSNSFECFFHIGIGHVAHAANNETLKPLVANHIILAKDDANHPFNEITKIMPRFILRLEQLLLKRNAFAHTTTKENHLRSLDGLYVFILTMIGQLIEHPAKQDTILSMKQYEVHDQFVNLQAYVNSRHVVELQMGQAIRQYKSLYNALVDVHYYARYQSNQYILECTSAIEAMLNEMLSHVILQKNDDLLQHTGKSTIEKLTPIMEQTDFVWEPENYPPSFVEAKMERVKRSKMVLDALKNEVISAKLYALLISLATNKQSFFDKLAQVEPHFFSNIIHLSDLRAHGNKRLTIEECEELQKRVFALYKSIFPIICEHN